jgi:hypothetical protein
MNVWSVVVLLLKRQLNSLPWCLLVCNLVVYCVVALLVVMEWTAAITSDREGLFKGFFSEEKNLGQLFSRDVPHRPILTKIDLQNLCYDNRFGYTIIKRVSWFKSSLLLMIQSDSFTNINS